MVKVIHQIDPNADTVITLKNPLVHFVVWNDHGVEELDATESVPAEERPIEPPADEPIVEQSIVEPNAPENSSHKEIQYHVSLSHLKLGSPHFERMLSGAKWKEGRRNENDGRYYVTVENWDEEAFLILLNVLHLRNRQVPRSVSLVMLAKIALLVDYYNCAEAVEMFTEMWVKYLKNATPIPSELCQNLVLWMYIAWVLRLPEEFTKTTAVAIKQSKHEEFPTSDLPITGFVSRSASRNVW